LHLFFISKSVVFVDRRRKNISCPRAQGTLATPLPTSSAREVTFLQQTLRFNFQLYLPLSKTHSLPEYKSKYLQVPSCVLQTEAAKFYVVYRTRYSSSIIIIMPSFYPMLSPSTKVVGDYPILKCPNTPIWFRLKASSSFKSASFKLSLTFPLHRHALRTYSLSFS